MAGRAPVLPQPTWGNEQLYISKCYEKEAGRGIYHGREMSRAFQMRPTFIRQIGELSDRYVLEGSYSITRDET